MAPIHRSSNCLELTTLRLTVWVKLRSPSASCGAREAALGGKASRSCPSTSTLVKIWLVMTLATDASTAGLVTTADTLDT